MQPDRICLWQFPEGDFAAWCELVGAPEVDDYRGYLDMLAAIQADLERQGPTVVRVKMSVADMRAALAERGWQNTPDRRAAILALH